MQDYDTGRIKRIRTFRGLTQRELGLKLGYEERNADVRIAQYLSSVSACPQSRQMQNF